MIYLFLMTDYINFEFGKWSLKPNAPDIVVKIFNEFVKEKDKSEEKGIILA